MSQRGLVLRMLRERGSVGVTAHELNYRHGITRSASIIFDLRQEGYEIRTQDEGDTEDGRSRMARYTLVSWPAEARLEPSGQRRLVGAGFSPPPEAPLELPEPKALDLPCGCARSADGRSWLRRCERHS